MTGDGAGGERSPSAHVENLVRAFSDSKQLSGPDFLGDLLTVLGRKYGARFRMTPLVGDLRVYENVGRANESDFGRGVPTAPGC